MSGLLKKLENGIKKAKEVVERATYKQFCRSEEVYFPNLNPHNRSHAAAIVEGYDEGPHTLSNEYIIALRTLIGNHF